MCKNNAERDTDTPKTRRKP